MIGRYGPEGKGKLRGTGRARGAGLEGRGAAVILAPVAYADLKIDYVFRRVFGTNPDVTMGLLNDLLGRAGPSEITSIEYLPSDQAPEIEGMKWSVVAVKCRDASDTTFVVEMQVMHRNGFLNRVVYNTCRAFTARLQRGQGYETLTPVVGVTVADFELWPDDERDAARLARVPLVSHWRMTEKTAGGTGIPQVEYVFCELPKLGERAPVTAAEHWAAMFRSAHRWTKAQVAGLGLSAVQLTALALSNEATFTEAEFDAYRRAREEYEQLQDFILSAEARGERRAEARGEAKGVLKGKRATLRSLCATLGGALTAEDEARVEACGDEATLDRWVTQVATTRAFDGGAG